MEQGQLFYDATGTVVLTKANTIFVKDDDGHDYAIYENDRQLFYTVMEEAYKTEDFTDFEQLFPNRCGGCPNRWREEHLD